MTRPTGARACYLFAMSLGLILLVAWLWGTAPGANPAQAARAGASVAVRNPVAGATATCTPGWAALPSPNVGETDSYLQAVAAVAANDAWAVGYFGARGARQTLTEHWDGTQWSVVPSPNGTGADNYLQAVASISTSDVWATGNSGAGGLILHWDGAEWSVVPAADGIYAGNYLLSVAAASAEDVWAVGYFEDGFAFRTLVERWDGSRWNVVPSANVAAANNELLGIAAISESDLWAVGNYAKGTVLQTLTEHWDGTQWSVVSSPNTGPWASFSSVAAAASNDVWAVGGHSEENPFRSLLEHWDGTGWSIAPGANTGEGAILSSVSAGSARDVWAVGSSLQTGSVLTEHWDGAKWSLLPGANQEGGNTLSGVAVLPDGEAWAVGGYEDGNLMQRTLVERYVSACASPTPTVVATTTAGPTATVCAMRFNDVRPDDYYYEAVRQLSCRGAISGYDDGSFRPYNLVTRGQLAKIVVLGEGWSLYTPGSPTFQDVPADGAFYAYIETAHHRGIISGYSCGGNCLEYRPDSGTTRGQLCKLVVLAGGWPLYTPAVPTFGDVPGTEAFYTYIETAYSRGIVRGYDCGTSCLEFRPGNDATRGQASTVVYKGVSSP
ncbi:MAG: S-layer homology domain-containing protein [Chloroflexia bacterium]